MADQLDAPPPDLPSRHLRCRTIGGQVYVLESDVIEALRERSRDLMWVANTEGDEMGDHDDQINYWKHAAPAAELSGRADELALAELAHQTDHPGDSIIHTPCKCCEAEIEYCPGCGCKLDS